MGATEVIKTRITPETKARVGEVTQAQLLTESIWLRRLVLRELRATQSENSRLHQINAPGKGARAQCFNRRAPGSSLHVRLRPDDRLLLHERSAARGMASATYVSVLVRSHLRTLAPLPKDELVALKRAVSELGAVGRNLNQIARAANQGTRLGGVVHDEFRAILKICEALRDHTKNLIKANAASWCPDMSNLRISPFEGRALLDIRSFAKRGPGRRDRLSPEEVALIGRTVRRTPEVMVKVLPKDSNNLRSVARHLNYIGRRGELELETDDGTRLQARDAGHQLVEDWDLDLDQDRGDSRLSAFAGRAPKLVHKVMLSMPPGTPARGVLEAARTFAREEFALKHRYALVMHTDEPHPHVHLVVKAVSEQGERLNIRKATLREWRRDFARHLRDQGIAANATERAVRGESRTHKTDGIYRATLRGDSRHMRDRLYSVVSELRKNGELSVEKNKQTLQVTRGNVEAGWSAAIKVLVDDSHPQLAAEVSRFAQEMPQLLTERELLAAAILARPRSSSDPLRLDR